MPRGWRLPTRDAQVCNGDVVRNAPVSRIGVDDGAARRCAVLLPARDRGVLLAAHRRPDRLLRGQVPPPLARRGWRPDPRRAGARDWLDGDPAAHHHGDLRVGRQCLLRDGAAARRNAQHLRRRQAVDVEIPAPRRPARDQRAARAGRPRGEVDHHLRGRDPRLLRAGIPNQGGCGSRRPSQDATDWSAPSTAARGTRE